MTEREKIIEVCQPIINLCNSNGCRLCLYEAYKPFCISNAIAENLIRNGVTVLPCKVGDTIYSIWEDDNGALQISEDEVLDVSAKMIWVNGGGFDVNSLGKSDFLSREEAEKAIAERCVK